MCARARTRVCVYMCVCVITRAHTRTCLFCYVHVSVLLVCFLFFRFFHPEDGLADFPVLLVGGTSSGTITALRVHVDLGILAATFMHYVGSVASNALIGDRDIGLKMIICDVPNSCANIEGRI